MKRLNQKGQMAIFIALIFQVLFVFFAMVINIGLLVHDKINLQNSVDLGAYYAAQKQAEMLNAIGHLNYQIRQSFKLLAWRYRVLGTSGMKDHPGSQLAWGQGTQPGGNKNPEEAYSGADAPFFCVVHKGWNGTKSNDINQCFQSTQGIPIFKEYTIVPGGQMIPTAAINMALRAMTDDYRQSMEDDCRFRGFQNWRLAATFMYAYRWSVKQRKNLILGLATGMSRPGAEFIDLQGGRVRDGVEKTVVNNLTATNRESLEGSVEIFNSLENVPRASWLPEIQTEPSIVYLDFDGSKENCTPKPEWLNTQPKHYDPSKDPQKILLNAMSNEPADILHSALGYEKNPWVMAYVGVRAKSRPRKLFAPGGAVQLVAHAFAKPFGGRVGPWYGRSWSAAGLHSEGLPIDALLPPRTFGQGFSKDEKDIRRLPNYSRFPGDKLGLKAIGALGAMSVALSQQINTKRLSEDFYKDIISDDNDFLPWDGGKNIPPDLRELELAAIAPDLFDLAYFSIEPNFMQNYWASLLAWQQAMQTKFEMTPDFGQRTQGAAISVVEQMAAASKAVDKVKGFFYVLEPKHLLNSWTHLEATEYTAFPDDRFGKCDLKIDTQKGLPAAPGMCIVGGRVGYSVKLISRDYLLSAKHELGGEGVAAGRLANPPSPEF